MTKSKYLDTLHKAKLAHKRSMKYLNLAFREATKGIDLATVKALKSWVDDVESTWNTIVSKLEKRFGE